jgi:hypothetical protein
MASRETSQGDESPFRISECWSGPRFKKKTLKDAIATLGVAKKSITDNVKDMAAFIDRKLGESGASKLYSLGHGRRRLPLRPRP